MAGGLLPGSAASVRGADMDGGRRVVCHDRPGRGVAGGAPLPVVTNTVRGYATSLAQWWSFLEQRGETGRWTEAGVPAVSGFLSWLRNGRTVEHALAAPSGVPSAETLHARLAALISFYQWQEAVHSVPVA